MSSTPTDLTGGFEFNDSQNQAIGSLARKMAVVGLLFIFFGALQMVNGISSLVISRNPDRLIAAAEKAGMTPDQLAALKQATAGDFWSSPLTVCRAGIRCRRFDLAPGRHLDPSGGRRICQHRTNQRAGYPPLDGSTPRAQSQIRDDLLHDPDRGHPQPGLTGNQPLARVTGRSVTG